MSNSTSLAKDKNCNPLVMAFIGNDDPARGDSRSATGLGRTIAEMLDGSFVYVDAAMLEKSFSNLDGMNDKIRAYLEQVGEPDIVVGTLAGKVPILMKDKFRFNVDGIAEVQSTKTAERDLVAHHLTHDALAEAGQDFRKHYPDIKGPLLGVMMGGYIYDERERKNLAKKIVAISQCYPELTVFVCPSRRTEHGKNHLVHDIKEFTRKYRKRLNYSFQKAVHGHFVDALKNIFMGTGSKLNLMCVDYETAVNSYNPYMGLLAEADHLICAGSSYSIVSEALFTGKNIYTAACSEYKTLKQQGYICDLNDLDSCKPFPTVKKEPLNNTRKVAESFVKEYKSALLAYEAKKASVETQSMPETVLDTQRPVMG